MFEGSTRVDLFILKNVHIEYEQFGPKASGGIEVKIEDWHPSREEFKASHYTYKV